MLSLFVKEAHIRAYSGKGRKVFRTRHSTHLPYIFNKYYYYFDDRYLAHLSVSVAQFAINEAIFRLLMLKLSFSLISPAQIFILQGIHSS